METIMIEVGSRVIVKRVGFFEYREGKVIGIADSGFIVEVKFKFQDCKHTVRNLKENELELIDERGRL